jgi:hypothetical protein
MSLRDRTASVPVGPSPVDELGDEERNARVLKSLAESAWIYPGDHS